MKLVKKLMRRWFYDALGGMALGLFSSLVVGQLLIQLGKLPYLSALSAFGEVVSSGSPVVGAVIGAAIAWSVKASPLTMLSACVVGAYGYVVGGPVGAYIGALVGSEVSRLTTGKTSVDILLTPLLTILSGGLVTQFTSPYIQSFMLFLGGIVGNSAVLPPLPMGMLVGGLVGMALTAPISSAALCIMLNLSGIAAGAAAAGCAAQMVGFAVISLRENGLFGLIAQGLGTPMFQFPNILRRPQIWIAPTLSSIICGGLSAAVFGMTNTAAGAGLGTAALVGQFAAFTSMSAADSPSTALLKILFVHFVLPAILSLLFDSLLRKSGLLKKGDMKITFPS